MAAARKMRRAQLSQISEGVGSSHLLGHVPRQAPSASFAWFCMMSSASSSCCCTDSSNFCVAMAEQPCSNPWRTSFFQGKIWDHQVKHLKWCMTRILSHTVLKQSYCTYTATSHTALIQPYCTYTAYCSTYTATRITSHTALISYSTYIIQHLYSLLHLECHFFILKSQSMIQFSRSRLPHSVEKRPKRLSLEVEIKWHSKCNML